MTNSGVDILDFSKIRDQFPILRQQVYGNPLIYLDNAATTQKPFSVINSMVDYYTKYNSNVHRGSHFLSDAATMCIEGSRKCVQKFINAKSSSEIIFTKGATESINLVAQSYGRKYLKRGDEVIISVMEHHSNILPWQIICRERQAELKIVPISGEGELDIDRFSKLLSSKTKIVSLCHVSNVLGTINPVKKIVALARGYGAVVLVDSAQALAHIPIDVQDLDCDFLVASSHKAYGPTGVGVLYAKERHLEGMDPYQTGGGMVNNVTLDSFAVSEIPFKFEAGTLNMAGIFAFQSALNFISEVGFSAIQSHEANLKSFLVAELSKIEDISILCESANRVAIVSFFVKKIHPLDIGILFDSKGIAVRAGSLCCQPLMNFFNVSGVVRISCAIYNNEAEILQLLNYLRILLLRLKK